MEIWDVLDKDRKPTGETVVRGVHRPPEQFHLVVHIWIKNQQGQYLITKRTPNKTHPNLWHTTGGSAVSGDDSLKTAIKETEEEIGLKLNTTKGKLVFQKSYPAREAHHISHHIDVWFFEENANIEELIYAPDEVSDAKWATESEILQMIKDKTFVDDIYDYLDELFKL